MKISAFTVFRWSAAEEIGLCFCTHQYFKGTDEYLYSNLFTSSARSVWTERVFLKRASDSAWSHIIHFMDAKCSLISLAVACSTTPLRSFSSLSLSGSFLSLSGSFSSLSFSLPIHYLDSSTVIWKILLVKKNFCRYKRLKKINTWSVFNTHTK